MYKTESRLIKKFTMLFLLCTSKSRRGEAHPNGRGPMIFMLKTLLSCLSFFNLFSLASLLPYKTHGQNITNFYFNRQHFQCIRHCYVSFLLILCLFYIMNPNMIMSSDNFWSSFSVFHAHFWEKRTVSKYTNENF